MCVGVGINLCTTSIQSCSRRGGDSIKRSTIDPKEPNRPSSVYSLSTAHNQDMREKILNINSTVGVACDCQAFRADRDVLSSASYRGLRSTDCSVVPVLSDPSALTESVPASHNYLIHLL